MKRFVILIMLAGCVQDVTEDGHQWWEPVCEEYAGQCVEWETRCANENLLEMCVCGRWQTAQACIWMGGHCDEWEAGIHSCITYDESNEGLGQGSMLCEPVWEDGTSMDSDTTSQHIPYLCYYFSDSYCASEWEGGICN